MPATLYNEEFFEFHQQRARRSAQATIPVLFEFVRPASVVDVGCGSGAWLAEFEAAGVRDYLGVDGDYVSRDKLLIEPARFLAHDLAQPLHVARRFDLAVSLEVAEHLPESSAATLVSSLARLAPVVLFSAAIPHQAGDGHVNEQWPEYWQELFDQENYEVVDCLRPLVWHNPDICSWYRQNMLLFVDRARLRDYPRLHESSQLFGNKRPLGMVHPVMYLERNRAMWHHIHAAQRSAMRANLRLRDTTLLAFPDWQVPAGDRPAQLSPLLAALAAHTGRSRLSVVIWVGGLDVEEFRGILREAAARIDARLSRDLAAGPEFCTVDASFSPEQWKVLLECVQGRIVLAAEDHIALNASGALPLPGLSLCDLQMGQMPANS